MIQARLAFELFLEYSGHPSIQYFSRLLCSTCQPVGHIGMRVRLLPARDQGCLHTLLAKLHLLVTQRRDPLGMTNAAPGDAIEVETTQALEGGGLLA